MTHASDGKLLAFLDDELRPDERQALSRHLAECQACAGELAELRDAAETLSGALHSLDAGAPQPAEAPRRRFVAAPSFAEAPASPRRRHRSGWLKAAVVIVGAAGVLSLLPGSPVQGWPATLWDRLVAGGAGPAPDPADPVVEHEAGFVSILPSGHHVRILLDERATSARIRVRLVEDERAALEVTSEAGEFRFRTGQDHIELIGRATDVIVTLPRRLSGATVEVGGRLYLRLVDGDVRVLVPSTYTGGGDEVVFDPDL